MKTRQLPAIEYNEQFQSNTSGPEMVEQTQSNTSQKVKFTTLTFFEQIVSMSFSNFLVMNSLCIY